MQGLQNIHLLRRMVTEHEEELRREHLQAISDPALRHLRRWLAKQLTRTGTWLTTEPTSVPPVGA